MGPENLSCVMNFDTRNSSWPFGVPWKPPPRLPSPGSARIICWLAAASRRWGVWGGGFFQSRRMFYRLEFRGSLGRPGTLVSTIVYLGLRAYLAKPVMPQLEAQEKLNPCKMRIVWFMEITAVLLFLPPTRFFQFEFILEVFGVALASAEPLAVIYRHGITPILHRAHECQIRSAPN